MTIDFDRLQGKTLIAVEGAEPGETQIIFTCSDGSRFGMSHSQDCCETVELIDVIGEIADLLNMPILLAEVVTNADEIYPDVAWIDTSGTWTFYKLATNRGYVTLRWFGSSNGYYSEEVDFYELPPANASA